MHIISNWFIKDVPTVPNNKLHQTKLKILIDLSFYFVLLSIFTLVSQVISQHHHYLLPTLLFMLLFGVTPVILKFSKNIKLTGFYFILVGFVSLLTLHIILGGTLNITTVGWYLILIILVALILDIKSSLFFALLSIISIATIEFLSIQNKLPINHLEDKASVYSLVINTLIVISQVSILFYILQLFLKTVNQIQEIQKKEKAQANDALQAKDLFLATISHEIRTPLNAVIGCSDLLKNTTPKEEQYEDIVDNLYESGRNLLSITNTILDLNQLQTGNQKLDIKKIDLNDFLQNIIQTYIKEIEAKNLTFKTKIAPHIPGNLTGDKTLLTQVFYNLLNNAIKFTHKGYISLTSEILTTSEKYMDVKFSIADSGIGIPKDKQEVIFDKFTQVSSDTDREYDGTGLGLAIVKKILTLYKSDISIESQLNIGTCFSFTIRFDKMAKEDIQEVKAQKNYTLNGIKVLVVEDNEINQMVTCKFLDNWQAYYKVADQGQDALDLIKTESFDLILMDLQMPIMNGYETATQIRKMGNDYTPIIAFSADAREGIFERIKEVGMDDYIRKPIEPNELFHVIQELVPQSKTDKKP